MTRSGVWTAVFLALAAAACAPAAKLPPAPVAAGPGIRIAAKPVPEFEPGKTQVALCAEPCGEWSWAGGLELTSPDTSRLHGLSDLKLLGGGRILAVSDEGDLLEAKLVLDAAGAPAGLADAKLTPLTDLSGKSISGHKLEADAEGLAVLANGDRLVSFERDHRIWLYPAAGGLPRPAPSPAAAFPANDGMEALAPDPARGRDAYVVGGEDDAQTWLCSLTKGCAEGPKLPLPKDFALTAVTRLSGGRTAWLLRAFDVARGARAELQITDANLRVIDRIRLERPATVDNMEGLAAEERPGGTIRFYLLADDNFSPAERTLLLAFDWRPPGRTSP
jgi:hypothetical protein